MTEGFEEEKHYSEYMEQCVLPAIVQLAVAVRVLRCVISSPAITHSLARLLACLVLSYAREQTIDSRRLATRRHGGS